MPGCTDLSSCSKIIRRKLGVVENLYYVLIRKCQRTRDRAHKSYGMILQCLVVLQDYRPDIVRAVNPFNVRGDDRRSM